MVKACVTVTVTVAACVCPSLVLARGQAQDEDRTRVQVVVMENALTEAVRTGAGNVTAQIRRLTPGLDVRVETIWVKPPEVRGFRVRPHGWAFYVRVPAMDATISWAVPALVYEQRLRARVVSQSVRPPVPGSQAPPASAAETGSADLDVLTDPVAAYRRSVKESIIDAMLEYSSALRIEPGEYLTVAAGRDAPPNPLDPSDDVRTVTFTVTGATLDAYHQKQLKLEEARKLVTVDEF